MNEVIDNWVDLNSFAGDFLNKFTECIKKDYETKHIWRVVCQFVQFGNDDWCQFLKCEGQNSRLMQVFAILMKLVMYLLLVIRTLKWHYEIWSGPGMDKLLQFLIALMNSTLKKVNHLNESFEGILSNNCMLTF